MAKPHEFNATIQTGGMGGAFVVLPFDAEEAFGSKRPKVRATFDGIAYRGTAVRMGSSEHLIIIRKEIREWIGKQLGVCRT